LFYNGNFYLLESVTTNYEQEVVFQKGGYGFKFDFNSNEADIFFEVRNERGRPPSHQSHLSEDQWQKINLYLEVIKNPIDVKADSDNIVGEKIPINLNFAKRDYDKVLIPIKDFKGSLEKSGKDYSMFSDILSGDYVILKNDYYKLVD
jgi:hypothetical protein